MRWTKVSYNSQLYTKHQTIYTLCIKRSHMSKVYNHKDKQHVVDKLHAAKTCFSPIEAHKQIATANCNEVKSPLSPMPWRKAESTFQKEFHVLDEKETICGPTNSVIVNRRFKGVWPEDSCPPFQSDGCSFS